MPGARLIGRLGADRHLARMAARIGPARVSFEGEMAITSCDAARMQIDMDARGIDRRRHTAATMHLTARIHSCDAGRCELVGRAVFRVYGRLAALGGILLRRVGDQLVSAFGDHFAARACAMESGARPSPPHCAALDGLALVWRMLMQRRRAQRRIDEHRLIRRTVATAVETGTWSRRGGLFLCEEVVCCCLLLAYHTLRRGRMLTDFVRSLFVV